MFKISEVVVVRQDEKNVKTVVRISGEEAEKWSQTIDAMSNLATAHGWQLPEVKWEILNEPV